MIKKARCPFSDSKHGEIKGKKIKKSCIPIEPFNDNNNYTLNSVNFRINH